MSKKKIDNEPAAVAVVPEVVDNAAPVVLVESIFSALKTDAVRFTAQDITALMERVPGQLSPEEIKVADRLRKDAKQYCSAVENLRVEYKAQVLERGRLIDATAKELSAPVVKIKERMEEFVKFEERRLADEARKLAFERTQLLAPLFPATELALHTKDLDRLTPEQFEAILGMARAKHEARLAEEAAAAKAKEEADKKAREEMEALRKQVEAQKAEAERIAKAQAEEERKRKAAEEAAAEVRKKEWEAEQAKRRAAEAEAAAEKAKALSLMQAEKLRAEAAAKVKRDAEEAAAKAARAPDKAKLVSYIEAIAAIDCLPLATAEGSKALTEVQTLLEGALNQGLALLERL